MPKKSSTKTFLVTILVVRDGPPFGGTDITADALRGAIRGSGDCCGRRFKVSRQKRLTDNQIIDIANERNRAMPAGADDQEEMLAIVRDCLAAAGLQQNKA